MTVWAAVIAAAAGIVAFFTWTNRQAAKAHARFTADDVEAALGELLDPQSEHRGCRCSEGLAVKNLMVVDGAENHGTERQSLKNG